ncbi:Zn-ribbon domain-containing OB-fold protein [Rhizobium terrae]|uniref:Zn-ribbon domain-containing OB-fold protein n=1 Tax=Rhizobium terrae TaxID=2171756 RepID=UPI000E3B5EB4|nr:OB-fold domain-containing protein [Rhizobium terrae]
MFELDQIQVPDLTDPNFIPFWEGTREHQLRIQKCCDCQMHRWPPRITCRSCHSTEVEWVSVEPKGTLFTYTIVGRPTAKGFSSVPYTVGFVTLDAVSNVRIIGNVVDVDPSVIRIGMALEGHFVTAGPNGEMTLIHWSPAENGA